MQTTLYNPYDPFNKGQALNPEYNPFATINFGVPTTVGSIPTPSTTNTTSQSGTNGNGRLASAMGAIASRPPQQQQPVKPQVPSPNERQGVDQNMGSNWEKLQRESKERFAATQNKESNWEKLQRESKERFAATQNKESNWEKLQRDSTLAKSMREMRGNTIS